MRPKRIWAWPDVWDSEHGVWASNPQGTPKKQYEYIHIDEHNLRLREVVEEALNREDTKPSRTEAEAVRLLMEIGSREDYRLSPTHWDKTWKLLIRLGVYLGKLPDWDAYRARYGEEEKT